MAVIDGGSSKGDKMHSPRDSVEVGRGLIRALRNTGIAVFYQSPDLRVQWAQNVPPSWAGGDIIGLTDLDFLPGAAADKGMALKQAVLASGSAETFEFRDGIEDGGRWYDAWIDADTLDDGSINGLVTTVVDITERKNREQTLRTLLREVSHRSKNLLAIIQSVATQTGRYSDTMETFLDRFRGRLQSLASSQDLVTSSNWRGAMLSELLYGQLSRFRDKGQRGVRFEGIDVHLNPNAALHIGLAIHELAVNSMSHGALARGGGVVLTSALEASAEGESSSLLLTWSEETDGAAQLEEKRFGSVALERVVPLSLDGASEFLIEGGSLHYRLSIPAANFDLD